MEGGQRQTPFFHKGPLLVFVSCPAIGFDILDKPITIFSLLATTGVSGSNEGKFHVSDASSRDVGYVASDFSRLFQGRLLLLRLAGLLPCHQPSSQS